MGRVSGKRDLPILENVLIGVEKGKITLSSTNLEMGIRTVINGKVEKEGVCTVSLKLLSEYVSIIKAEKITLSFENGIVTIKTDRNRATFATLPAAEFPPFPAKESEAFTIDKKDIMSIAGQVAYAASIDESRPVLTGLKFKPSDEGLVVAATDGFRLSVRRYPKAFSGNLDSLIPAKSFMEVAKLIGDVKEDTGVAVSYAKEKSQLIFEIGETVVYSRLIEGEYPNFERIIPTSSSTTVVVDKELFTRAVKAASIFARDSANIVKFHIADGKLLISANTPQIGEEKSEIEAQITGPEGEIAFNYRFLIDFIGSLQEDEVQFQMTNALAPGVFKSVKDPDYTHIIMPVRVQS